MEKCQFCIHRKNRECEEKRKSDIETSCFKYFIDGDFVDAYLFNEIVYFELNNWSPGRDYPDEEPFNSWLDDDFNQQFRNDEWAKKNELCIALSIVDMSQNYCVTATKSWVEENCPKLLTKFIRFLKYPAKDDGDEPPRGQFGCPFLEYEPSNFGVHWFRELDDYYGGTTWVRED